MEIPIIYTNNGIGYFCTDKDKSWIELNRHLKKYPKLHQMVLEHELGHNTKKRTDFLHDLKDFFNFHKQKRLTGFILKHPSALSSLFPLFFTKKGIAFNWFMFMFWGIIAILLLIGGIL
jgi:hypothetical protein